jgi:hypothetical protein
MTMVRLRIGESCEKTGSYLQALLGDRGVNVVTKNHKAIVCWGMSYRLEDDRLLPSLNANANKYNKLEALQLFAKVKLPVVPYSTKVPTALDFYPALGRQFHHVGGRDIHVALYEEEAHRLAGIGKADYFTHYIQKAAEYRSWFYRGQHLGTYTILPRQNANQAGANHIGRRDYVIVKAAKLDRPRLSIVKNAVSAIELDFGAVDYLIGKDGKTYILEVNSAPGCDSVRDFSLNLLADHVQEWVEKGFPNAK